MNGRFFPRFFLVCGVSLGLSSAAGAGRAEEAPQAVSGAVTVSLSQAKSLHDQGAVFIDVRDTQSWTLGHIEGAVHLDFHTSSFAILYYAENLDKDTPLVFYSSSSLNRTGAVASYMATHWGYRNVHYFREGFYSWMAADLPVELKLAGRAPQLVWLFQ